MKKVTRQEYKRAHIIQKTIELCSQYGFNGTSMDRVTSETGVSKATIYKYFVSKENLLAEALEVFSKQGIAATKEYYEDPSLNFETKLVGQFTWLESVENFNGCYYQLAYYEFNQSDKRIADISIHFKKTTKAMLVKLLKDANISNAELKADKGEVLFNGLLVTLHMTKDRFLINTVRDMYCEMIFAD